MLKFLKPSGTDKLEKEVAMSSGDDVTTLTSFAVHLLNHAKDIHDIKTNVVELANAFNHLSNNQSKVVADLMHQLQVMKDKVEDLETVIAKKDRELGKRKETDFN